jgi:tetratricopeptide (TPR) repeat protein
MLRKLIILSILQISALFSQTQIAVVDFEALDVSKNDAIALSERLGNELLNTGQFKVLERQKLNKIIQEQKFQLSGLTSDEYLAKLGNFANVQQIVDGSISKVGNVYAVSARLIDVETAELIRSGKYDHQGNIGELMLTGMASIASQLSTTPVPIKHETTELSGIQKRAFNNGEITSVLIHQESGELDTTMLSEILASTSKEPSLPLVDNTRVRDRNKSYLDGHKYYKSKDYISATREYEVAVSIDPSFSSGYYMLALIATEIGNINDAENYYHDAVINDPNHYKSWYNLGKLYYEAGNIISSIRCLERAIQINAGYSPPIDLLKKINE